MQIDHVDGQGKFSMRGYKFKIMRSDIVLVTSYFTFLVVLNYHLRKEEKEREKERSMTKILQCNFPGPSLYLTFFLSMVFCAGFKAPEADRSVPLATS